MKRQKAHKKEEGTEKGGDQEEANVVFHPCSGCCQAVRKRENTLAAICGFKEEDSRKFLKRKAKHDVSAQLLKKATRKFCVEFWINRAIKIKMGKKGVALPSAQSIETDPPVDFLVKNMVECDSDLLRDQLLSDLQYASLCEMETSVPLLLKKDLMTSWILFYQAHGRLFDLIVWLVRKELTEGKAYPQVSSPLLCHLTKMLLSVEENENAASLLPSFEATTGLKDRAQERLFDPLILLAIEKEKEGSIFSTHSLLQFLLEVLFPSSSPPPPLSLSFSIPPFSLLFVFFLLTLPFE